MLRLWSPDWVKKHYLDFSNPDEIPAEVFQRISNNFRKIHDQEPVASIVIIAGNDEKNILKPLSSLSELKSRFPYEVIVVNNNSSDSTRKILEKCNVKIIDQPVTSIAIAREAGLNAAKGKYHLCADSSTIYSPKWMDELLSPLERGEAICTFGRVSFIPDGRKSRLGLAIFEFFKDVLSIPRAIRRPEFVAWGASLAFYTRMGRQAGWSKALSGGEAGQMVSAMKSYGKVKMITSELSRIWTSSGVLDRDGNFFLIIFRRLKKEIARTHFYFTTSRQNA